MTTSQATRVNLEIWSDVACPWCYVGLRNLRTTLAAIDADDRPIVAWRAFQLDATIPVEGVDADEHYVRKFGSRERIQQMHERLIAVGEEVGIEFRFDRMRRVSNTLRAHRLMAAAQRIGLGDSMIEALFSANFEHRVDIGDVERLAEIADDVALDASQAEQMLRAAGLCVGTDGEPAKADGEIVDQVDDDLQTAVRLGISSVPCFVANRSIAVPGAVPPPVLMQLLVEAAERQTDASA